MSSSVAEIAKRYGVSDWTVYQVQKSLTVYASPQFNKRETLPQDSFVEVHVAQPDIPTQHQLHQAIILRKAMLEFEGLSVTMEGQIQHSHITGLINLLGGGQC